MNIKPIAISIGVLSTLILGMLINARAIENEVWLSPNGPTNTTAAGTPEDPFRCPSWASLQTVLGLSQFNSNTTFHFMSGTFLVAAPCIVPKPGWKLRGAGVDNTVLQLQSNTVASSGALVIYSYGTRSDNVEVSDLTVDCNLQHQSAANLNIAAVELDGSDTRISKVKAINWGTTASGSECFVLSIFSGASNEFLTNCIIEDCIVTHPAAVSFACGVSCITVFGDGPYSTGNVAGGVMQNNLIENIAAGSGSGMPNYVNGYAGHGTVSHNRAINLPGGNAVYRDSWNGRDIVIEDNVFDKVGDGINFLMDNFNINGLVIKNNVIRPLENGLGISYETTTGHTADSFLISGNAVYPSSTATNITPLALNALGGRITVSVMNNVINGGGGALNDFFVNWTHSPWNDAYPHELQLNTWSGNVNFAGTQIVEGSDGAWQPGNEDTVKFIPTTNGWYRVVVGGYGLLSAAMKVKQESWANAITDTEFWYRVNSYTTDTNSLGEIGITRRGSYYYGTAGNVPSARIVSDYPNSGLLALDIYVTGVSANTNTPAIQVSDSGPFRQRLSTSPQLITNTPAVSKVFNF